MVNRGRGDAEEGARDPAEDRLERVRTEPHRDDAPEKCAPSASSSAGSFIVEAHPLADTSAMLCVTIVFVDRIVLNVDAGELPDEPEELYALAHLVNVACGAHAGDDASMDRVLAFCKQFGTRAGAHP